MIGDQSVAVPLKNIGPVSAQDDSNLNFNESYTLTLVRGDRRSGQSSPVTRAGDGATEFGKPFDFVGTKTFGSVAGYEQYAKTFIHEIAVPGCAKTGRVFVGQRDESFVVNLGQVFDLVNFVPVDADVPPDQGGLARRHRHQAGSEERHHLRRQHHDVRAGAAGRVPHRQRQRRDRRLDFGEPAPGAHAQSDRVVRETRRERRRLDAGLAPVGSRWSTSW